ncbi:4-oxalocrotonate tautomerase family protein [Streptomyces chrestomyceticus]|uniref:4-oxalocrotonate tautomerase family protein n=1 Tax=Streptomyces chrestomyceticus TaxID=68185 RepID=UPI003790B857
MPFIEVKIYEKRLTPETERRLIERLTDASAEVFGDEVREHTWVVLQPVPAERWGIAGRPGSS